MTTTVATAPCPAPLPRPPCPGPPAPAPLPRPPGQGPAITACHFKCQTYPGAPAGASEVYLKEGIFVRYFANSLPASQARMLWAEQRGASTATFGTPSKVAAWRTVPSWYFISTGDQIITPQSELAMAHRAHSHITVFQGGSHLTLISNPRAVTKVIMAAACAAG